MQIKIMIFVSSCYEIKQHFFARLFGYAVSLQESHTIHFFVTGYLDNAFWDFVFQIKRGHLSRSEV